MRLVFLGSGAFGLPTLERLARTHELLAIVTQPDKPAGRDQALAPTPVGAWGATRGLRVEKLADVNEPSCIRTLRELRPDALVVIAFGQKLGPELLADLSAINLHASRLPRWRGAAPINHAILARDAATGNSVIALAQRMDAGVVYAQSLVPIAPTATAGELHDLLADDGAPLVEGVLDALARGSQHGEPQDPSLVTLAPKLSKSDAWVDFEQPADVCRARINGLSPWPGVSVQFRGGPLRLLRAETAPGPGPTTTGAPGQVLDPAHGLVHCGDGSALRLLDVQAPGRRVMAWAEFARGQRPSAGETLGGGRPC